MALGFRNVAFVLNPLSPNVSRHLRWCTRIGGVLFVTGLVYLGMLVWTGATYEGPTSFRKPMLFGFSFAVTLWSCAWVGQHLKYQRGDPLFFRVFPILVLAEVMLIALQQARGVRSHFNHATPFDAGVTTSMGWIVTLASIGILYLTVRTFVHFRSELDWKLAAQAGMVFLALSCFLGFFSTHFGEIQLLRDQAPEVWGKFGVLKFPHGVPLHAIQVLFGVVWIARRLGTHMKARVVALSLSTAAISAATIYASIQTFSGRSRFDPSSIGWILAFAVGMSAALAAVVLILDTGASSKKRCY